MHECIRVVVEMTVRKPSQTYKPHTKRSRYQSDLPALTFISCEAQILPKHLESQAPLSALYLTYRIVMHRKDITAVQPQQ